MTQGIYLVTCTENRRRYVGSSWDIEYRWMKHRSLLNTGRHFNPWMQHSWDKYGPDSFEFAVIEEVVDRDQLRTREQHWIDLLHPDFNITPNAFRPDRTGYTNSPEHRQRQSESITGWF